MADSGATGQVIIAVLGAGGFGAILAAMVTGLFSKRKLGAEATEIITKAAAGVVTNLNDEIARMSRVAASQIVEHDANIAKINLEHTALLTKIRLDHDVEMADIRAVLQLHVAWDVMAIAKLNEAGFTLSPPPPLLPPRLLGE